MMAASRWRWNLAALETLMAEDQLGRSDTVLRTLSVVELWRLRRVCHAFCRWSTAALAALPRVAVVGGQTVEGDFTSGVEVLDLSTLRWSSSVVPALPEGRRDHAVCSFRDGRVVVMGGQVSEVPDSEDPDSEDPGSEDSEDPGSEDHESQPMDLQWVRGTSSWMPLPDMVEPRHSAVAVALSDGRTLVLGGHSPYVGNGWPEETLASGEVLAAAGSSWRSTPTPMSTARFAHVAALLPCGRLLVAGGYSAGGTTLKVAELWDPLTGVWSDLPPLEHARMRAACCMLPSGRVAVVGGHVFGKWWAVGPYQKVGEVFDPQVWMWQSLPDMAHARSGHAVVPVAGGLLAVGGCYRYSSRDGPPPPDELFDEASGRWFVLPHSMVQPRSSACAVLLHSAAPIGLGDVGAAATVACSTAPSPPGAFGRATLDADDTWRERRARDAQAPVGTAAFDDSGDEDQDLGGFGLRGGALSDGLQHLIDDTQWAAANPVLYGRLIDRMEMTRREEIRRRAAEVGVDRERAEREQIATAAAAVERARNDPARTAFKQLSFTDPVTASASSGAKGIGLV